MYQSEARAIRGKILRLALEASSILSMVTGKPGAAAKTQQGRGYVLDLLVSDDQLSAKVRLTKSQTTAACTAADVVAFVRSAGLSLGKADEAHLPAVAEGLAACQKMATEVVCHGVPAKPWPAVEWFVPLGEKAHAQAAERGTFDLHQVIRFANTTAGHKLCILPAAPTAGHDVFGHPLPVAPAPVQLGAGVGADPLDPRCVVALKEGCARLIDGVLSVEDQLDVKGDLDFKLGNIDFWGAVVIHGNVPDDFQIKATQSVVIEGSVGMVVLQAGGDLTIKGGVNGGRKARLACGGTLHAHFLHGAHVEAGRDVVVDIECLDSTAHAGGDIKVLRGGIIGGEVRAKGNVEAAQLGSELCVPTAVASGHTGASAGHASTHEAEVAEADELVAKTQAELAHLAGPGGGKLTAVQRERQTALQGHLATAQEKAHRARRELAEYARQHGGTGSVIKAAKAVFPRVTVSIGGVYHLTLKAELKGPAVFSADAEKAAVKVEARKATDEPLEHAEESRDPAARWRRGVPVLVAGLVLSLMLSWSPVSRLLLEAGPLKVAACEVVDAFAGGARARVKAAKGQTLELGWEDLERPQECVPEGTLVVKRRWSFDYEYNGARFEWPRGGTRYLGPLAALLSLLAFCAAAVGKRLASRSAGAHRRE